MTSQSVTSLVTACCHGNRRPTWLCHWDRRNQSGRYFYKFFFFHFVANPLEVETTHVASRDVPIKRVGGVRTLVLHVTSRTTPLFMASPRFLLSFFLGFKVIHTFRALFDTWFSKGTNFLRLKEGDTIAGDIYHTAEHN